MKEYILKFSLPNELNDFSGSPIQFTGGQIRRFAQQIAITIFRVCKFEGIPVNFSLIGSVLFLSLETTHSEINDSELSVNLIAEINEFYNSWNWFNQI